MNDLINTLRMYAEDMHSAIGHSDCSSAMSLAADLLEEQKGTIAALNIALGGADSTSTENLIDAHEIDIADVGLITMCRKLMAENFELEASPLSEEALDILRSKNKQLEAERDQLAAQNDAMREALYKLACLGNGDQFGNSIGNSIAQDALNLPNLAAEVLKRRDAETLRRAADRFEAVEPHPKHWDWLRRMANEIDGKETT